MNQRKNFFLIILFFIATLNILHAENNRGLKRVPIKNQIGTTVGLYKESHALVIGVSHYTHGWPKLAGVKFDAKEVTKALRKNGFQVNQILDPNAQELKAAFEDFINRYGNKPENRLLFYFAGHGFSIKPKWGGLSMGYIVPTDAPNPHLDIKGFKSKALPMQRIEEYALSIDAKHALFLFDSCFSGSLFSITRAIPKNISYKTAEPVRQFITAGSANEEVPDISIFRQQFIAALNGEADLNQDHYLSATELGEFLQEKVINYSKGAQHPQYGKIRNQHLDKGDFIFTLPKTLQPKPIEPIKPIKPVVDGYENRFWDTVLKLDSCEMYRAYVSEYPTGHYQRIAKIKQQSLCLPISAPKLAQLTIRSNLFGDEVWINGEKKGTTRLDLKLKAGTYQVEVKKVGYLSDKRSITLKAGEQQKWIAQLSQQPRLKPLKEVESKRVEKYPQQDKQNKVVLLGENFSLYNRHQSKRVGQYIVNNNGTVKDTKTGLMWKRCPEGLSGADCSVGQWRGYTFDKAVHKFKNIHYAGYSDWRLPTKKELSTLVYCSNGTAQKVAWNKSCSADGWSDKAFKKNPYQRPTINQQAFPNTSNKTDRRSYVYWSSSPYVFDTGYAWILDFEYGAAFYYKRSSERLVRLVRAGQ